MTVPGAWHEQAWTAANELRRRLHAGAPLPEVEAEGAPLLEGEIAHADVLCATARYYATEICYPLGDTFRFEEHPVMGRRLRQNFLPSPEQRRQAEREAEAQWREFATARTVLTNLGLHLQHNGPTGPWIPFAHAELTDFRPDPTGCTLVLAYETTAPLLLEGPPVPWLTVALQHVLP